VWTELQNLKMLAPARDRWQRLPLDDRRVVALAFSDAVSYPNRVGDYILTFRRLKTRNKVVVVTLHQFRIGFVNFILVDAAPLIVMHDFWFDDDYEVALVAE
jgi:archaellum biogenesis ATPase FlaH